MRPGVFRCAPGAQMALGALLGEVGAAVQALNRPLVGRRGVERPGVATASTASTLPLALRKGTASTV